MTTRILVGDCRALLADLAPGSVQTCVTSPPYFGLRDYGMPGQIGLETRLDDYIAQLVDVFAGVWRTLADDGTLWLNLGDSYVARPRGSDAGWDKSRLTNPASQQKRQSAALRTGLAPREFGTLKAKDLMMVPARVAMALQDWGWFLRADIIWAKPNAMPESVTDRPTKAHEYLFLLSKSPRYHYNAESVREPLAAASIARAQPRTSGQTERKVATGEAGQRPADHRGSHVPWTDDGTGRNARSVWTVPTQPYKGAHFATMPAELARRCIVAGSSPGDVVLDPFGGAGTTALAAHRCGRDSILLELNPEYAALAQRRLDHEPAGLL